MSDIEKERKAFLKALLGALDALGEYDEDKAIALIRKAVKRHARPHEIPDWVTQWPEND